MKHILVLGLAAALAISATAAAGPASQRVGGRTMQPGAAPAPAPRPHDTFNSASHIQDFTKPFAPTGLTTTSDVQICTQHGGFGAGLACKALLPQGRLVLIWNYANGPLPAAGFHVWRVDGGAPTRIDTQAITPDLKIFIADPPPGGYAGACYAVSAYAAGGQESDLTPGLCANGLGLVRTATFAPTQLRSMARRHMTSTGLAPSVFDDDFPSVEGNTEVGYHYATDKGATQDISDNYIYRTGLLFDVSSLAGKSIRGARLTMTVDNAFLDPSYDWATKPSDHRTSCVAKIGVGLARWWSYTDWIEAAIVLQPGEHNGPDISMDVTPIVQGWRSGQPNLGIVLEGEEENLSAFTEKGCVSTYLPGSTQLVVEYQ